jgi:hypothetical protein
MVPETSRWAAAYLEAGAFPGVEAGVLVRSSYIVISIYDERLPPWEAKIERALKYHLETAKHFVQSLFPDGLLARCRGG